MFGLVWFYFVWFYFVLFYFILLCTTSVCVSVCVDVVWSSLVTVVDGPGCARIRLSHDE